MRFLETLFTKRAPRPEVARARQSTDELVREVEKFAEHSDVLTKMVKRMKGPQVPRRGTIRRAKS